MIRASDLFGANINEIDAGTFGLFIQTADAVLKYSEAVLNKAGLSLIKLRVLQLLQLHGGTLRPSEIATLTLRERHNITTLMRRLEKSRLIKSKPSRKDKRSINVTITEKGRQAIEDASPAARKIVKQIMSSFPDSQAAVLEELLKILKQNALGGLKS